MKEETNISAGTPPTNSVGTGVETSLPPAVEPPGIPRGSKVIKRKKRKKIYEAAMVYAFRVTIADLGDIVIYAKTETQVRTKLRDYLRNSGQIINIQRIFATDVIDFYTQKRAKAMKRLPDVVLEQMEQDKEQAKDQQQVAKQNATQRLALVKKQAAQNLALKKKELQKSAATGTTPPAM
jgi:hypothetical protein